MRGKIKSKQGAIVLGVAVGLVGSVLIGRINYPWEAVLRFASWYAFHLAIGVIIAISIRVVGNRRWRH